MHRDEVEAPTTRRRLAIKKHPYRYRRPRPRPPRELLNEHSFLNFARQHRNDEHIPLRTILERSRIAAARNIGRDKEAVYRRELQEPEWAYRQRGGRRDYLYYNAENRRARSQAFHENPEGKEPFQGRRPEGPDGYKYSRCRVVPKFNIPREPPVRNQGISDYETYIPRNLWPAE